LEDSPNPFDLGLVTVISLGHIFSIRKTEENSPQFENQSGLIFLFYSRSRSVLGGNITHAKDYFLEVLPPGLLATFGIENTNGYAKFSLEESSWEEVLFLRMEQSNIPSITKLQLYAMNPETWKGELDLQYNQRMMQGGENW